MICNNSKTIFIHNLKTAGTSIELSLAQGGEQLPKDDVLWGDRRLKVRCPELSNYQRFSVIRNPWDRRVSWHRWVNRQTEETLCSSFGIEEDRNFCEAFFMWQINNRRGPTPQYHSWGSLRPVLIGSKAEAHLNPRRDILLLRFESLDEDWKRAREILGIKAPDLKKSNAAPDSFDYTEAYTPELAARVFSWDKWDVDVGGYSYPSMPGDWVANFTKALNIPKCGGCENRRKKMNRFSRKLSK